MDIERTRNLHSESALKRELSVFDQWKGQMDGFDFRPEKIGDFLKLLSEMPVIDNVQAAKEYLQKLLTRNFQAFFKEKIMVADLWKISMEMPMVDALEIQALEEDGVESYLLNLVKNFLLDIDKKLGKDFPNELKTLITELLEKFIDRIKSYTLESTIGEVGNLDAPEEKIEEGRSLREIFGDEEQVKHEIAPDEFDTEVGTSQTRQLITLCAKQRVAADKQVYEAMGLLGYGELTYEVAEYFSKVNIAENINELFKRLRAATDDSLEKMMYSRILYLIESGRVTVENGAVNYLNQTFKLSGEGLENIKLAFRITGDGKVGLFNEQDHLLGYFELGDLSDGEQEKLRQIMDIDRELVLANLETPETVITDFKDGALSLYENDFYEKTGVRLNDLTLREQLWFRKFVVENSKLFERVKLMTEKFGRAFLLTFIGGEQDAQIGERLLAVAENQSVPEKTKQNIFLSYGKIINNLDKVKELVKNFFVKEEELEGIDINKITSEIARRAFGVLRKFVEMIENGVKGQEIGKQIEVISNDVVVFASIFKNAFEEKRGVLNFSEFQGVDCQLVQGTELAEQKNGLIELLDRAATNKAAKDGFRNLLEDSSLRLKLAKNSFYILSREADGKKETVATLRVEEIDENTIYIGSLAVSEEGQGAHIGDALMKTVASKFVGKKNIRLVAIPEIEAGTHYVSRYGAVGKKFISDVAGTKNDWFEMEIPKAKADYSLRRPEAKKIEAGSIVTAPLSHIGEQTIICRFDSQTQMAEIKEVSEQLMNKHGYVLVRYEKSGQDPNIRIYGFELPAAVEEESLAA